MPHRRRQRGTITIEFALIFPGLVAVLFAMIDGGRLMGSRVMLSQAAIAASRAACLSSTTGDTDVAQAARDTSPMLAASLVVPPVTCTNTGWPKTTGDVITVQVQYTFYAGFFTSFSKTLTQQSRMVCE